MHAFNQLVLSSPCRIVMPIAVYPGLALTGARVTDLVHDAHAQFEAAAALQERYQMACVLSAMDLSVEAEAFGCALYSSDDEVPSVTGRLVTSMAEAQRLATPTPGDKRTRVYLETVAKLRAAYERRLVLAGCIGPFSLAARLVGVSEAMELTVTEPELMEAVLEKSAAFLAAYIQAFRAAGADGVIMAEPAAGLLSPRSMSVFSSAWIRTIHEAIKDERFCILLHNCAARRVHWPAVLETGLSTFHFGAPMDLPAALATAPEGVVICGNLDPTGVFVKMEPSDIHERVNDLLAALQSRRNFVLSSGCDVPRSAPLANLDAFFRAARAA